MTEMTCVDPAEASVGAAEASVGGAEACVPDAVAGADSAEACVADAMTAIAFGMIATRTATIRLLLKCGQPRHQ